MTTVIGGRDIGLLRLCAQRLAGPRFATATDAVRWMTALQGQDAQGVVLAVALRLAKPDRLAVTAAFDAGSIVRSWPMRGTLHVVAAEDLGWMQQLTTKRLIAGAASRRALLDLDDASLEQARELAVAALVGGRRLRRAELVEIWDAAGLLAIKQRSYHFIWHLAQTGTLVYGPTDGKEQLIVLADEWISAPRRLEHDEALGEWALRYFRSHGPATVKDFAGWTQLLAADVKTAMAIAKPLLEHVVIDDVEYFLDPSTSALLATHRDDARATMLLPGFDEYLLGYQQRNAVLPDEFAQRIVPGSNGMFLPTVVSDGQVVGTWKRTASGAIVATPFTNFSDQLQGDVESISVFLARFCTP
jgi:hypothetical protein